MCVYRRELQGFDLGMRLKRAIQLSKLVQIDKSKVDSRRITLVFAEGVATHVS